MPYNYEMPDPWREYAERKGIASLNQLARASGLSVETVRKVISHGRTPRPETAAKLAQTLGIDPPLLDSWFGFRGAAKPYEPPVEASRLSERQRRAVDEIIRAMVSG